MIIIFNFSQFAAIPDIEEEIAHFSLKIDLHFRAGAKTPIHSSSPKLEKRKVYWSVLGHFVSQNTPEDISPTSL